MAPLEEQFEKATMARDIPGVILLAADASGSFSYARAFGEARQGVPIDLNATFIMASCTKLQTTIAALQCMDRGLVALDDDVMDILTELKDVKILAGYEGDEPILKPVQGTITLRQLLTHSSGSAYDALSPHLLKWRLSKGQEPGTMGLSRKDRLDLPFTFEPGTGWAYGYGIDWAGVLVERLSGLNLQEYFEKNIWGVLGIENITFHQELKPKVRENLVKLTIRGGINTYRTLAVDTGKPVEWTDKPLYDDPYPIGEEMGGQGAIGSATDYLQILLSILRNDGKLLKPETVDEMFIQQLGEASLAASKAHQGSSFFKDTFSSSKEEEVLGWGLGGLLLEKDSEIGRGSGTLTWSGLPNLLWRIDRETGLVLFYAGNLLPFGDFESHRYEQKFEKEMYKRLRESREATL